MGLMRNRAIWDSVNMQLHLCGPGEVRLTLPPGTMSLSMELSRSGHTQVPFTNYDRVSKHDKGVVDEMLTMNWFETNSMYINY